MGRALEPPVSLDRIRRNLEWLRGYRESHPYSCSTDKDFPRPEKVHEQYPDLVFICAPVVKTREWRFQDQDSLFRFKKLFATR